MRRAKSLSERELLGDVTIVIGPRERVETPEKSDEGLDKLIVKEWDEVTGRVMLRMMRSWRSYRGARSATCLRG